MFSTTIYSAIPLRLQKWKNIYNPETFHQSHRILSCITAGIVSGVDKSNCVVIIECTTIRSHCINIWLHCPIGTASVWCCMVCGVSIRWGYKQTCFDLIELHWCGPQGHAFNKYLRRTKHTYIMSCRYNMVDFPQSFHKCHPTVRLLGEVWVSMSECKLTFIFCPSHRCDVYNIMLSWTAL